MDQELLPQDFNSEEILTVIKSFSNFKIPGKNRLPVEFYQYFGGVLQNDFMEVIEKVSKNFKLPDSWNEGVI